MTIPNRLSIALCAAFLLIAPLAGLSWQDILIHLAAGSLMLFAGIVLFSLGWMGGGDGKLLAVASLWLGFEPMTLFLVYVAILGGALALLILAIGTWPAGALPLPNWALRLHAKDEGMPYGIAIAAGALAIYPSTQVFAGLAG